jgi:DNA-binding transcriptional MerR regulator
MTESRSGNRTASFPPATPTREAPPDTAVTRPVASGPSQGALAAHDGHADGHANGHLVKIGELADRLGLTTRALRYWEERSLLPPARRTSGGMRVYGDEHVRAARGILRLKHAGFTLDEIVEIQRALHGSTSALEGMGDTSRSLAAREARIRERIAEQQALLAELEAARRCIGLCDGCHGKTYDAECITCLTDASGHAVPDCLSSLLEAATMKTTPVQTS